MLHMLIQLNRRLLSRPTLLSPRSASSSRLRTHKENGWTVSLGLVHSDVAAPTIWIVLYTRSGAVLASPTHVLEALTLSNANASCGG